MNAIEKIKSLEQDGKGYLNPKVLRPGSAVKSGVDEMNTIFVIERILIVAILLVSILQLGGLAARAEVAGPKAGPETGVRQGGLSERLCRENGSPHNDMEACRMLMQIFG